MSLWFELRVNAEPGGLALVAMRRLDYLDTSDRGAIADAVCRYEVRLSGQVAGQVEHRYGDGPLVLARKALELVTAQGGAGHLAASQRRIISKDVQPEYEDECAQGGAGQ